MLALLAWSGAAHAEVTRVEIARRGDVGMSGYEKIVGTIHFAVDPKDPRNRLVVGSRQGASQRVGTRRVLVRPVHPQAEGAARKRRGARGGPEPRQQDGLNGFNRGGSPDPATENDLGDRFLMRFGYTLVWVGWEFDVPDRPLAMRIHVPVARERGKSITGVVRAAWTATAAAKEFVVTDLAAVRRQRSRWRRQLADGMSRQLRPIACSLCRGTWRVKGHTVTLDTGFEPGTTYRVSYRAANPPVAGLGFVAVRDTTAWLKHQPTRLRRCATPTGSARRRADAFFAASCMKASTPTNVIGRCSTRCSRTSPARRASI